jgi:3-phosphoshikimate 1-carboxyvinyltransferase
VPVNPGNVGAVLRFLLAVGALLPEVTFVTDHPESLGKRPNGDLLEALEQLGCVVGSDAGRLPITLRGGELRGGAVTISGAKSSQFLSGLLFLAPLLRESLEVSVKDGLVSKAPVRQTVEVLRNAGIQLDVAEDLLHYKVQPGSYRGGMYRVNGDWPGSAALLAAVAVAGGEIELAELLDDEQGEKAAGQVLAEMGAEFSYKPDGGGVRLVSNAVLRAVEFDGDLATDAVLALMGAACFAEGRTRFYNVSNLRIKECDRISEPLRELRKLGVKCWEGHEIGDSDPDAIIIEGNPSGYEGGVTVDGRDDHRVIMLLSIVALRCKNPVRILRSHQVAKSYPTYFDHLTTLGARVELQGSEIKDGVEV